MIRQHTFTAPPRVEPPPPTRVFGLDVLRVIAIVTAVYTNTAYRLSGAGVPTIPLFNGVDLFFVLSGFLVGGSLLQTLRTDGPGLRTITRFWSRRSIRTLPSYYLVLTVHVAVATALLPAVIDQFHPSVLLFAQNLLPISAHHGFFAEAWSLAVGAWFYLLLPLLILPFAKLFPARAVALAMLAATLLVIMLSTWARALAFDVAMLTDPTLHDDHIRKVVVMRLDALAIGVLGALCRDAFPTIWRRSRWATLPVGIAMVSAAVVWAERSWVGGTTSTFSTFAPTLLATGLLLVIPAFESWTSSRGRVAAVVTYASLISYSLYLVHNSLLNVPLEHLVVPSGPAQAVLLFVAIWVASVVLAMVNHRWVESPLLALHDALRPARDPKQVARPVTAAWVGPRGVEREVPRRRRFS